MSPVDLTVRRSEFTRRSAIPEMMFKPDDRFQLADMIAVCRFSTESSLGLSLRRLDNIEGIEIGWLDLHVTRNDWNTKIYFRLCLRVELTTLKRINWLRQDCYRVLAIPESAYNEMTVFWPDRSCLLIDDREGFISYSGATIPPETPLLEFQG